MTQNNDTLFNDQIEEPDVVEDISQDDKDYFSEYVGEGKKYRDEKALAKAIYHKDEFIERLKTEQANLRQDLQSRIKMEEFLDRMNDTSRDGESNQRNQDDGENQSGRNAITPQDLKEILDQRERDAAKRNNLSEVKNILHTKLGPNYVSKVRAITTELGLDEKFATDVAATNPKAFYKLLGLDNQPKGESFEAPPRSVVNTEGFKPNNTKHNYAWYRDNIYKKDPNQYWTPKVQNEMREQAALQGDEFYK